MYDRGLSDEQKMMRQSCRDFVDDVVLPFIKKNWQQEWSMTPENRLPASILEGAEKVGIRTLGVPEEFGGIELEKGTEVRTFAMISEEIARGDSGLSDKLVQNWKVSVLLRQLAPRHLQEKWFKRLVEDPQFLMAHCLTEPRGASDRWLPYNVPEAVMQTKAVKAKDGWVSTAASTSSRTVTMPGSTWFMPIPIPRSECCKEPHRSWCPATPKVLPLRAATRRSDAAL